MNKLEIGTEIELKTLFQEIEFAAHPVLKGTRQKLSVTTNANLEILVYRLNEAQIRIDIVQK